MFYPRFSRSEAVRLCVSFDLVDLAGSDWMIGMLVPDLKQPQFRFMEGSATKLNLQIRKALHHGSVAVYNRDEADPQLFSGLPIIDLKDHCSKWSFYDPALTLRQAIIASSFVIQDRELPTFEYLDDNFCKSALYYECRGLLCISRYWHLSY